MTQRTRVTTRVLHLDPHLAWPTAIFTTIAPKIATPAVAPKVSAESTNGLVIHQWTHSYNKKLLVVSRLNCVFIVSVVVVVVVDQRFNSRPSLF